ncbi:hypothetical protein COL154_005072 [Colletotrichum chrysophilum]|nr:hypothetical protein COL154_005072 [Colletotrichum chrysophilum]
MPFRHLPVPMARCLRGFGPAGGRAGGIARLKHTLGAGPAVVGHGRQLAGFSSAAPLNRGGGSTSSAFDTRIRPAPRPAIEDEFKATIEQARNLSSRSTEMYTASFAFFEALWDAGVTHCFVNLGSDHPSIIEAMVKGQRERKGNFPRIITCPNEVNLLVLALKRLY